MESTWEARDLPVLSAVVELCDEDPWGRADQSEIADRTGLSLGTVEKALWKLDGERPPFFELSDESTLGGRAVGDVRNPSGHAQRIVGAWPTPASVIDRMILALQEAAKQAEAEEEQSRLQRAAEALGDVGRGVVTGVMTHVLTQGI